MKTEAAYAVRVTQICARAAKYFGLEEPGTLPPSLLVRYTVERKSVASKSTWRQNKAAVCWHLERVAREASSGELQTEALAARELLGVETQAGASRRGTRTSAIKQKGCQRTDLHRIIAFLRTNSHKYRWASPLGVLIGATFLTGLRPCEWADAQLVEGSEGIRLLVRNAKHDELRANGEFRTLELLPTQPTLLKTVRVLLEHVRHLPCELTYDDWQRRVSRLMTRVARAALGRRRRYPSIYSLRHQFSADAKASGITLPELAALMGHASDATASSHYGKRARGTAGTHVKAAASEVETVRNKIKSHPANGPKAHSGPS
jgi:integrase